MVARSVDNPRTVTERITSASQRIDEAVRAQGRGAPALRDSAGNVLLMNPAAPYPLLGPQGTDAAVAFTNDGTIKITSADTTEDRDMTVRDIASSGNVQANNLHADGTVTAVGDMTAVNFHATGQTTCNNLGANSANIGPLTAGDTSVGVLWSNVIHASGDILAPGLTVSTDANGVMRSFNYYGGTFHGVIDNTSDARLKEAFTEVNPADVDGLLAAPVQEWNYTEEAHALDESVRHVGPVAQDMPAIAVTENEGRLGIDQITYSGLLLALCQRQQRQIDDLTQRVNELGKRGA